LNQKALIDIVLKNPVSYIWPTKWDWKRFFFLWYYSM